MSKFSGAGVHFLTGLPPEISLALPMDYAGNADEDPFSERTSDVSEYKRVCINFLQDISADYKAWVDYYKLPPEEDARRRREIDAALDRSCRWLTQVPRTISAVDVVMNDGIQKMAEATAGRPFHTGVFVNQKAGYVSVKAADVIPFRVRASGRDGRRTCFGHHYHEGRFRLDSTCGASIHGDVSDMEYDDMDVWLEMRAPGGKPGDVISFTVILCEKHNGNETERRGRTTIIHLL